MLATVIIALIAGVLLAGGFSLYAIDGTMTLKSAGLIWIGSMLAMFLIYIRLNEFKRLIGGKSAKYGANMVVMILVFIGVMVAIAIWGAGNNKRFDLTKNGRFSLSTQTKNILNNLEHPVKAVAFYRFESGTMHAVQRQMARDLLESYAAVTDKFTFTFVDPERNPGLASKYGQSEFRIILLMSQGREYKVGNETEEKMTNGLLNLVSKEKNYVYWVKGHGEKELSFTGKDGYSAAREAMLQESYEIKELFLMREESVPEDASLVVVSSPQKDLSPEEYIRLDEYYKKGGALFVQLDPGHPPTLRTWLESYGFKLQSDVIIDRQTQIYGGNAMTPAVYAYNKKHPLTQDFTLASYFPIVNSVYIDEDPKQGRYQLAMTGPSSWTETDRDQLENGNVEYNEAYEKRGPVPVMAVSTYTAKGEKDETGSVKDRYGKIILIGDSDFATNTNFNLVGNRDLFMNTVHWLAEKADFVGVRARKRNINPVTLNASQARAVFWIPVVMVPCMVLMTGVGIYSRRRWFRQEAQS
ncbi:MAG: GldG family protein [Nitrospinota bacterium]|nr:GldG family protein [Nitrospinota bacterium]MDH5677000.1 GldG family protein [Nitrospinota bacterium]MDH5756799.1 GldG family protein [Nitrospinota bacterium]